MDRNKNLLTGNNDRESTPSHERSRVSQNSPDLPTSPLDTPGQVSIYLSVYLFIFLSIYLSFFLFICLSIYLSINVTYFPKRQLPKGIFLSGNFPNMLFHSGNLPCTSQRAAIGPHSSLRSLIRPNLTFGKFGNLYLGSSPQKYTFGKYTYLSICIL